MDILPSKGQQQHRNNFPIGKAKSHNTVDSRATCKCKLEDYLPE